VRSGEAFERLLYVADGQVIPGTMPQSVLESGFLIGLHEYLLRRTPPVWVSSYFALPHAVILALPTTILDDLARRDPNIRANIEGIVLRRYARFCWTSLSTVGTPKARVAAAIVSRLVLDDRWDVSGEATLRIHQKDLIRLTALSRTSVYKELGELESESVVQFENRGTSRPERAGRMRIPDVGKLRSVAETEITTALLPSLATESPTP